MTALLFLLFWLACAILTYGLTLARFERTFPAICDAVERHNGHRNFALGFSLLGPCGLLGALVLGSVMGMRGGCLWSPLSIEEADQLVQQRWTHEAWVAWRHYTIDRHEFCPSWQTCQDDQEGE